MLRKWFVNYCSIGVYVYLCIDNYKSMEKVKEFLKKLWSLVRVDGLEHIVERHLFARFQPDLTAAHAVGMC